MVKRSPRKRATAAAADAVDKEKGVEEEEGEGEDKKSNRSEADKGAIEENPLFEDVEKDDNKEKLNESCSKLKRTRKPTMPNSDAVGGDAADENSEGEEESMEITAVETVRAAEDEDEPLMKKSKNQEEGNLASNEADLDENIQPEKLKVAELRNELKVSSTKFAIPLEKKSSS